MTFHSLGRSSSQARTAPRFCRVRDAGSRIQYAPELFGIASAWKRRLLELNEQFPTTKMAVWNSNSRSTHGSRWDSRWEVLILFSWNSHEAYPRFIRTGEDNIKFTPFPTPPPPPKILENAIPMRKQFRAGIARSLRSEHFFLQFHVEVISIIHPLWGIVERGIQKTIWTPLFFRPKNEPKNPEQIHCKSNFYYRFSWAGK